MLRYAQNKSLLKNIFLITLLHVMSFLSCCLYSPSTKINLKKNISTKENFTVVNEKFLDQNQKNISQKITHYEKYQNSNFQKTTVLSKKIGSSNNKNNNSSPNSTNEKKNKLETKDKIKKLSETLLSQIDSLEVSSQEMHSLYEITKNDKILAKIQTTSLSNEYENALLDLDIIDILQKSLTLPEPQEDVIILLSLSSQGSVLSIKIEKSNSTKNSEYCIKEIKKLPFLDLLRKYNLKQDVLFRIKLTT